MDHDDIPSYDETQSIIMAYHHEIHTSRDPYEFIEKSKKVQDAIYRHTANILKTLIPNTNNTSLITALGLKNYLASIKDDITIDANFFEAYDIGNINVNNLLEDSNNKQELLEDIDNTLKETKVRLHKNSNYLHETNFEPTAYFLKNDKQFIALQGSRFSLKHRWLLITNTEYKNAAQNILKNLERANSHRLKATIASLVQTHIDMMKDTNKIKKLTHLKFIIENKILSDEERYDRFIEIIAKSLGFNRNPDLSIEFGSKFDDLDAFSQESIKRRQEFFGTIFGSDTLNQIQFDIIKYNMIEKILNKEGKNKEQTKQSEWTIDRLKSGPSYATITQQNDNIIDPKMAVLYLLFADNNETQQIDHEFADKVLAISKDDMTIFSQVSEISIPTDTPPNNGASSPFSAAGNAPGPDATPDNGNSNNDDAPSRSSDSSSSPSYY